MNTVTIKVLTDDGIGIPNLVAVLYDLDKVVSPNTTGQVPTTNEDWGFWSQFAGDRLGSTITDSEGTAQFKFEDGEFQVSQIEKRPDLIVFVLAPERYFRDVGGLPTATPPQLQIMHRSEIARANAGRQEAYVIEISNERLDKFNVPGPRLQPEISPKRLAEIAARGWEVKKVLRDDLQIHKQEAWKKIQAARANAKRVFENFVPTSLTKALNGGPFFVNSKGAPEKAVQARNASVAEGIKRLKGYEKPFVLQVPKETLDKHGITFDHADRTETEISSAYSMVTDVFPDPAFVRRRMLTDLCKPHSPNEPPSPPAPHVDAEDGSASTDVLITTEEARRQIADRVLGQVADLHSWDPRKSDRPTALASNIEALTDAIKNLELVTGPADEPAFHDFHTIQIAFPNVWTEIYDEGLTRLASEVYTEWDYYRQDAGFGTDDTSEGPATGDRSLGSVDDVASWIDRLESDLGSLARNEPVPAEVTQVFYIVDKEFWSWLDDVREQLRSVALEYQDTLMWHPDRRAHDDRLRDEWLTTISNLKREYELGKPLSNLRRTIKDLRKRILERYNFRVFATTYLAPPDEHGYEATRPFCNFGLLLTYRQIWDPQVYQVGDLVATIPLSPGEKRSYSKKRSVTRSRNERELDNALSIRRTESTITTRAVSEIVKKASMKGSFKNTSDGSFKLGSSSPGSGPSTSSAGEEGDDGGGGSSGGVGGSSVTSVGLKIARESAETKQDFHEAVTKAVEEYKREHTLEVTTSSTEQFEEFASGEISNPNNEITVTYLFYELQRRYLVSEYLRRVAPVLLVPLEVPAPHEIDEDWLIANEWILRRVLLDDSFKAALDYLKDGFASDEYTIAVLRDHYSTQRELVRTIQAEVQRFVRSQNYIRDKLTDAIQAKAVDQGLLEDIGEFFGGGGNDAEAARAKVEATERAIDFIQADVAEAKSRLGRAESALEDATRKLTMAVENQLNKRVTVDQLRIHVKENVIYYMQAIWDHEVPDQRFMRLYHLEVDVPEFPDRPVTISRVGPVDPDDPLGFRRRTSESLHTGVETLTFSGFPSIELASDEPRPFGRWKRRRLVEIADVDNPLGYKGNYLILPLREHNYITMFMAQRYIHDLFGVWDPDEMGNYTADQLAKYLACLRSHGATPDELRPVEEALARRLQSPRLDLDSIVVPSDQLFIEALPGVHPVLEPFKMLHRAIDVSKAVAEVRSQELDNLRRASRLIEGEREDPDVDKRVVIEGATEHLVVPPEA